MKLNIREIILSHLQYITGVGKEYIAPFPVNCHELMLAPFEIFKSYRVVAFNPACFV